MALADQEPGDVRVEELRRTARRLERQLAAAKARTDDLIEAVYRAAKDAAVLQGPARPVPPVKDRRKARGEIALVHATDWQCGKQTETFSTDVLEARITKFAHKVLKLTALQRTAHPVRDCVVMLGGDMVEGLSIFPGQAYEVDSTLFEQLFACARIIETLILTLAEQFETVTVFCEYGNHGRIGRRGDLPAGDNIDRMTYAIVQERVSRVRNVVWNAPQSWYSIVTAGNYRALLVHGDEIRSFGGNVPAFGILRKCNAWAAGAIADTFTDAYLGHFHTPMTLTMANGHRAFVTGSPESGNVYAQEFVAATGIPSQRLHFVDPDAGRVTGEFTIWLDR